MTEFPASRDVAAVMQADMDLLSRKVADWSLVVFYDAQDQEQRLADNIKLSPMPKYYIGYHPALD